MRSILVVMLTSLVTMVTFAGGVGAAGCASFGSSSTTDADVLVAADAAGFAGGGREATLDDVADSVTADGGSDAAEIVDAGPYIATCGDAGCDVPPACPSGRLCIIHCEVAGACTRVDCASGARCIVDYASSAAADYGKVGTNGATSVCRRIGTCSYVSCAAGSCASVPVLTNGIGATDNCSPPQVHAECEL